MAGLRADVVSSGLGATGGMDHEVPGDARGDGFGAGVRDLGLGSLKQVSKGLDGGQGKLIVDRTGHQRSSFKQ